MSWKDDKDLGPWEFTEQPNKWGYLNNPRWSSNVDAQEFSEAVGNLIDPTSSHVPCGHWHKETIPTYPILTTDAMWQQTLDVLANDKMLGVGGMSDDSETEYIVEIVDYDEDVIQFGKVWDTTYDVSGYPGTTRIRKVSGVNTTFYLNYFLDVVSPSYGYVYYLYKINTNGVSSKSLVFSETPGALTLSCSYCLNGMAISKHGIIVAITYMYDWDDGNYYIYTNRSTDWGDTWEGYVRIVAQSSFQNIWCDEDGKFYITASVTEDTEKPFCMWESTDDGETWDEVATVPTTPVDKCDYLSMAIDGTKIHVIGTSDSVTYLWDSSDSGATWNTTAIVVGGETYLTYFDIAVNEDVIIVSYRGQTTKKHYILRSDDAGVTWTVIGQRYPADDWSTFIETHPLYGELRNYESTFVFSSCGSYVSGTNYLGYLLSEDDGLTWTVKELPISYISGVVSSGATVSTLPDEPQVWSMD